MKAKLIASLRGLFVVVPVCLVTPALSGCGTSADSFDDVVDQLWDDLEDADDLEEIADAWDDFFEELED